VEFKPSRGFRVAILLASLTVLAAEPVWAGKQEEDLAEVKRRIEALQQEVESAEDSRGEARDALKDSERAISDATRKLRLSSQRLAELKTELTRLHSESETTRTKVEAHQAALAQLLVEMHRAGEHEALKLLLDGRDPGEIARELRYFGYLAQARARVIASLREELATLGALTARVRNKSAELTQVQAEQVAEKARLEKERAKRSRLLQALSRQIETQRREISTLKEDEARLARLIERLKKIISKKKSEKPTPKPPPAVNRQLPDADDSSPFAQLKGKLKLPVKGELGHLFGSPRENGGLLWKGIFILAKAGEQVRAIASGTVVYSDWLRGFGNLLIVDHGSGYMSLYGNNESLYKQAGEAISAGDVVSIVGNSGGSADSGLYFELRHQGKPLDPMGWVTLK
jgi:murein hydrolase activator